MRPSDIMAAYDTHTRLAAGYRLAGEADLARAAHTAAEALKAAYNAVIAYRAALLAANEEKN